MTGLGAKRTLSERLKTPKEGRSQCQLLPKIGHSL